MTLAFMALYTATEADLMEQTEEDVRLVDSTFWPKPGQTRRRALIAAGVILAVCALAGGIGGTRLPMGNPQAALELLQVEPSTDAKATADLPSDRLLQGCSTSNCGACSMKSTCNVNTGCVYSGGKCTFVR